MVDLGLYKLDRHFQKSNITIYVRKQTAAGSINSSQSSASSSASGGSSPAGSNRAIDTEDEDERSSDMETDEPSPFRGSLDQGCGDTAPLNVLRSPHIYGEYVDGRYVHQPSGARPSGDRGSSSTVAMKRTASKGMLLRQTAHSRHCTHDAPERLAGMCGWQCYLTSSTADLQLMSGTDGME